MANQQEAEFQLKTALTFIEMTGSEKYTHFERKRYFMMAFMHAKIAATMAHCMGERFITLGFHADNVASDCMHAVETLLDGGTIEEGRETFFESAISRRAFDKSIGLPTEI